MNTMEKVLTGWILGMLVFALVAHKFVHRHQYKGWCFDATYLHEGVEQRVHGFYLDKEELLRDIEGAPRPDMEHMAVYRCDQ